MALPPDSHVHSEWSWDALSGSMDATCVRAVDLGLPSLAFTEHADVTSWTVPAEASLPEGWDSFLRGDLLTPPILDLDGYRACLDLCRSKYPMLRILSGVELSEPHWHQADTAALLLAGRFDRILASVHSTPIPGVGFIEFSSRYLDQPPDAVVRDYLAEAARMVVGFDGFEILAHIDYPVRYWPTDAKPYDPTDFEADYRSVLEALASADKVLEVNTRVPLHVEVVRWWHDIGGKAISFASDAHDPSELANGFAGATQLAEAAGFRPSRDPFDFWGRA